MTMGNPAPFETGIETGRKGSRLVDFLYPLPARRSVGKIFKWWEKRRLAYNAIICAGGSVSLAGIAAVSLLNGTGLSMTDVGAVLRGVFVILVAANILYLLGPVTESLAHKLWGREVRAIGPHLFRAGLIFSVGLTFVLPTILVGFQLVLLMLRGILG
ncbi:MAG: hypothetical protein OXN18_13350 [Gemmatimonadota bacterium]|nr:hypothetical protein [Gemmatimonadota bacterium]